MMHAWLEYIKDSSDEERINNQCHFTKNANNK